MSDIDAEMFYTKLDEIKKELYEVKSDVKSIKDSDIASRLETHIQETSRKIAVLHNRLDEHISIYHSINSKNTPEKVMSKHVDECHSTKRLRDNWAALAAIGYFALELLKPFIQKITAFL